MTLLGTTVHARVLLVLLAKSLKACQSPVPAVTLTEDSCIVCLFLLIFRTLAASKLRFIWMESITNPIETPPLLLLLVETSQDSL